MRSQIRVRHLVSQQKLKLPKLPPMSVIWNRTNTTSTKTGQPYIRLPKLKPEKYLLALQRNAEMALIVSASTVEVLALITAE
jgi:hypothetical protein